MEMLVTYLDSLVNLCSKVCGMRFILMKFMVIGVYHKSHNVTITTVEQNERSDPLRRSANSTLKCNQTTLRLEETPDLLSIGSFATMPSSIRKKMFSFLSVLMLQRTF